MENNTIRLLITVLHIPAMEAGFDGIWVANIKNTEEGRKAVNDLFSGPNWRIQYHDSPYNVAPCYNQSH